MTRDEQEMIMWRRVYERWCAREGYEVDTCGDIADAAVAEFRKRYPVEPAALPAVWYDEPPFPKDGRHHACWVLGEDRPGLVYRGSGQWLVVRVGGSCAESLAGRRVSPITKPPEPPQ